MQIAIRERDALKKAKRELESKLAEREAKLAEREAADAAAAEEQERKRNDHMALIQRREKERDEARKEAADAKSLLASKLRSEQQGALVDAVMPKLGLTNRTVVRGVLRELEARGLDIAPEQFDDKYVADVTKKVREELGDLFAPKSGGSPGTPGVNLSTKPPAEKPDEDPTKARIAALQKARARK